MTVTATAPTAQEPGQGSSLKVWSIIGAGLLVAVCVAAFAISQVVSQPSLAEARSEAVAAADTAVTRIFTGPTTARSRVDRAGDLMTTRFRDALLTPTSGAPDASAPVATVTRVREASAAECGDDCTIAAIDVLVFADQDLGLGTGARTERRVGVRMMVRMVHEDGEWRVDGVQNV